jgi:hypothetical protein
MDRLTDLKAREEEVAREWEWLNDTINRVAQLRAEDSEAQTFRILQEQVRVVGQRRVELMMEVAHLEKHGFAR